MSPINANRGQILRESTESSLRALALEAVSLTAAIEQLSIFIQYDSGKTFPPSGFNFSTRMHTTGFVLAGQMVACSLDVESASFMAQFDSTRAQLFGIQIASMTGKGIHLCSGESLTS